MLFCLSFTFRLSFLCRIQFLPISKVAGEKICHDQKCPRTGDKKSKRDMKNKNSISGKIRWNNFFCSTKHFKISSYPWTLDSLVLEPLFSRCTLESDADRLRDSAPSETELFLRDLEERFFLPSVIDSSFTWVEFLTEGEFGAFPSNSSRKSCNKEF